MIAHGILVARYGPQSVGPAPSGVRKRNLISLPPFRPALNV